jgi:hypothetical protein
MKGAGSTERLLGLRAEEFPCVSLRATAHFRDDLALSD